MNEKKPNSGLPDQESIPHDGFSGKIHDFVEWAGTDMIKNHSNKLILALVVVVIAIAGVNMVLNSRQEAHARGVEKLGEAYSYLYSNKQDSALTILQEILSSGKGGALLQAKANLFAGNIFYNQRQFDQAETMFRNSMAKAPSVDLIGGAAQHGLASVLMQQEKYPEAIAEWEQYLDSYAGRTGDLKARYQGDEPRDLLPTVSDAMWKLALTYRAAGQADKAKEVCEKILKVYNGSVYATKARKLLAVL